MAFGMLPALMVVPLVFAALVVFAPAKNAKVVALWGTIAALVLGVYASFGSFDWKQPGDFQLESEAPLFDTLGVTLKFGTDSVSMLLIMLTLLLGPICILCSWTAITERPKTFYGWFLVLQSAMTGVFASRDVILFYTCFEFTLIPMWVLINLYGSTNRRKAATKFFLYTFTGSVLTLAGVVYVAATHAAANSNIWSFDIGELQATAAAMPMKSQAIVLLALMLGFAVKVPLFPLHTWLPLAHTEAPTAGSVILAGVLLKLGTYGLYRFALPFCPAAVVEYAPTVAVLAIIGILYGGLICWVQEDVKKLVAYSSVAHLGFCVLGLFALNSTGIRGSILYMINHGLSTGALFLLIGMIYERYHTRSMRELGGLAAKMPVWATFMVFFTMASVGLPGTNGFVSEFMCLLGAFQAGPTWFGKTCTISGDVVPGATGGELGAVYAAIAGIGMIVAAMYLLMMVGKVVWGPLKLPVGHDDHGDHGHDTHAEALDDHGHLPTDLNGREIGVLVPLAALCLFLGLYPKPVLDVLEKPVDALVLTVDQGRHMAHGETPTRPEGKTNEHSAQAVEQGSAVAEATGGTAR